jgi:hypothetical protein
MRTTLKLSHGEDESKENQQDYFVLNFGLGQLDFTDSWKEKREVGQSGLNDISFSCGKRLETSVPPKSLRNSPEVFDMLSSRRQTTGYKLNV